MRMGKPGGGGASGKRRVRVRLGLCLFGSFIPKRAEENLRNGSTCVMGRWGFVRWFSLISCLIGDWVDSRESSLLRRLERGREIGL